MLFNLSVTNKKNNQNMKSFIKAFIKLYINKKIAMLHTLIDTVWKTFADIKKLC